VVNLLQCCSDELAVAGVGGWGRAVVVTVVVTDIPGSVS